MLFIFRQHLTVPLFNQRYSKWLSDSELNKNMYNFRIAFFSPLSPPLKIVFIILILIFFLKYRFCDGIFQDWHVFFFQFCREKSVISDSEVTSDSDSCLNFVHNISSTNTSYPVYNNCNGIPCDTNPERFHDSGKWWPIFIRYE